MNRELQNGIDIAENSMPPPLEPHVKKKNPVKHIISYILVFVFVALLVRIMIDSGTPIEPVYEVQIPDSASITASAAIIEDYVQSEGFFPPGLTERIESNSDISLMLNDDSSFTYIEAGVVYRSAPGILHPGGEERE